MGTKVTRAAPCGVNAGGGLLRGSDTRAQAVAPRAGAQTPGLGAERAELRWKALSCGHEVSGPGQGQPTGARSGRSAVPARSAPLGFPHELCRAAAGSGTCCKPGAGLGAVLDLGLILPPLLVDGTSRAASGLWERGLPAPGTAGRGDRGRGVSGRGRVPQNCVLGRGLRAAAAETAAPGQGTVRGSG